MRRIVAAVVVLLMAASTCLAYTGTGGVWAMKAGDFVARNFAGTQAGIDAAVTYAGSSGYVQIGPGLGSLAPTSFASGVTVVRNDSTGWSILGNASLYLRGAYKNLNGTTDPAIYSDQTISLTSQANNYAQKEVDIVNRFSDSTSATGLSLNAAHFINRYGVSGVGGGNFDTGIGVGAYSEHRGNSVVTGSMYGAENASTMYNGGSVAYGFGSLNTAQITTGANANITNAIGSRGIARIYGGTGTITTAVGVSGIAGTEQSASGTITDAIGGRFETEKSGATITTASGVVIPAITQGSTNNYGLRITGAASGGSNINQSLRVDAGDSYMGGKFYPDGGIYASSGHNIDIYRNDGSTLAIRFQGTDGGLNITGNAYLGIAGFKAMYKSGGTVRILASAAGDSTQGIAFRDSSDANNLLQIRSGGALVLKGYTFAGKPSAPTAGMMIYCSDCTRPSDPATSGGTGGMAIYANSRWYVP